MTVSRCLGRAAAQLSGRPRGEWKGYIATLPEACPATDCTSAKGCRELVAEYFRVQWGAQVNREAIDRRKKAGGLNGQG